MKTKGAKNKPSIHELQKDQALYGEAYFNLQTFKQDQKLPNDINVTLALEYRKWADNDGDDDKGIAPALRPSDFRLDKGINKKTWEYWLSKFEGLREAHTYVLERLASRRERGATTGRFIGAAVEKTIGWFDHEISRVEQERLAKLKEDAQQQMSPIHLHFPAIEKTELLDKHLEVKDKK